MRPATIELGSGLVALRSKEQAHEYVESMLEYYKARSEEYGGQMGELLRTNQSGSQEAKETKAAKEGPKQAARGWVKVGSLPVNSSDPQRAIAEVTLKIVDDYRTKIDRTNEALKSIDGLDAVGAGPADLIFFVNKGLPEAVIVREATSSRESFTFNGSFRAI